MPIHKSFAYYRLPYSDRYYAITSEREPLVINSYEAIDGQEGFVIAPFAITESTPIVLIRPDNVSIESYAEDGTYRQSSNNCLERGCSQKYSDAFATYHQAIHAGRFHKLVLARTKTIDSNATDLPRLFEDTCAAYPRLMIMLFSTPLTGTWIIASPEILIDGKGTAYHTMALAGTMPYSDGYADWSEKNKREQHVVEQYIEQTITPLCRNVVKDGPYTMRAGNLQHLRTDFHFQMDASLGCLLSRLHPTPAVCGMPKHEAQRFIVENEGIDRRYYSGFAGPVGIDGHTSLYVSLRCAELFDDHADLYAGGGIMPDSQCEAEWQETESKMKTIGNVL